MTRRGATRLYVKVIINVFFSVLKGKQAVQHPVAFPPSLLLRTPEKAAAAIKSSDIVESASNTAAAATTTSTLQRNDYYDWGSLGRETEKNNSLKGENRNPGNMALGSCGRGWGTTTATAQKK